MSDFIETAKRAKLLFAVVGIFLSGVMMTMGLGAIYHRVVISSINTTWQGLLDEQQRLNREKLDRLAVATDANTDAISRLLKIAESATIKADEAAKAAQQAATKADDAAGTARRAATTASGAAANAARANIGKREFPSRDKPVK